MDNQFTIGNPYTLEEIESKGFTLTRKTSVVAFFRKDSTLMVFNLPKPQGPKVLVLISILTD